MTDHPSPRTLSMDIGGSFLKVALLNSQGKMIGSSEKIHTPYPCTPSILIQTLEPLIHAFPKFDRVSIGFPGVVRENKIITAPHFDYKSWKNYDLGIVLTQKWKHPVRILNDAEVQGLAAIRKNKLELVVTLGTGVGTALFYNGILMPHLELAHHPIAANKTYNEYLGDQVLKKIGKHPWNQRIKKMIITLQTLLNFDFLFLGGGNARHIRIPLPSNALCISNELGLLGGFFLWTNFQSFDSTSFKSLNAYSIASKKDARGIHY